MVNPTLQVIIINDSVIYCSFSETLMRCSYFDAISVNGNPLKNFYFKKVKKLNVLIIIISNRFRGFEILTTENYISWKNIAKIFIKYFRALYAIKIKKCHECNKFDEIEAIFAGGSSFSLKSYYAV